MSQLEPDTALVIEHMSRKLADAVRESSVHWAGMQQLAQQLAERDAQIERLTERLQASAERAADTAPSVQATP